jgi:hypothetical protein
MRISHLVTVAGLVLARDSVRAQDIMVAAQAIPVVTRADPTATRLPIDEGYLSQPIVMSSASWRSLRAIGTLNLEGLTLPRGELSTGGYGEGFVDRRHPHAYVHELLAGVDTAVFGGWASIFAGRGFVPFGSDDPMVRPFEKYPINHHLAQILERVEVVGAIQRGPIIGEVATFNGDEPLGPGTAPDYRRFGDSWSSRLTLLPFAGVELSASYARVRSPEERTGAGLSQRKGSLVARFISQTPVSSRYALVEWAHTNELDRGETVTSLGSLLGEAAYCRAGVVVAGRVERTDRPEEDRLLDPFRTPRPAVDLSNLGISRWTTITASVSPAVVRTGVFGARPFVEIARLEAVPGSPPGIFNSDLRYGSRWMWMLSTGVRLTAGMPHPRMGRYGAAIPRVAGTQSHMDGSHDMPAGVHDMAPPSPARVRPATSPCVI